MYTDTSIYSYIYISAMRVRGVGRNVKIYSFPGRGEEETRWRRRRRNKIASGDMLAWRYGFGEWLRGCARTPAAICNFTRAGKGFKLRP